MVSGKNSVIFRFFFRHHCKKSLWKNIFLVSLHSCTSPLVHAPPQLTLFPSTTTCAVEDSQHLRFGNSQSPDKFTGKPKTKIIIYKLHCAPSTHLRGQCHSPISPQTAKTPIKGHLSTKGFDLPPITTQSSPYCCSTMRTTFRN